MGKIEIRDPELVETLRRETAAGEAWIEAGGVRYLVVPSPCELTDPEEVEMARDAAASAMGPVYGPEEAFHRLAELRARRRR